MIGLDGVQKTVAQLLVDRIPARVTTLRAENGPVGIGVDVTPQVVFSGVVDTFEIPVEDWPFLVVVGQDVPGMTRIATDGGTYVYMVRYAIRVFAFARGQGYEETSSVRGRLTLAVREVLLSSQRLTAGMRVDETSLVESYSDVSTDGNHMTVAGSYVQFTVDVEERLTALLPDYGPVATTSVTPSLIVN